MASIEIAESAGKHGVTYEAMLHAVRNPIAFFDEDELVMVIAADESGRLLEIGVLNADEGPVIVHAMEARTNYLRR